MSFPDFEGFLPKNFPPDFEGEPKCPHFTLIQICTDLAGLNIHRGEYCGQKSRAERRVSLMSGFDGTILEPVSTCIRTRDELHNLMTFMEREAATDGDLMIQTYVYKRWEM